MKMAMSVESVGVHSVLRDSISNSSSQENNENITNKIIAIAKKILLTTIEYEEVNNYDQSVRDAFKSKYTVLKSFSSGKFGKTENGFERSCNQNSSAHLQNFQQLNQKYSNELPQPKRILFPRDSVHVGWRSSRKWQIGSGMMNVGNTCYLNSTLQAIFHVPAMANWLISDSDHREDCRNENGMQDGCIICAMAKTLISSQISSSAIRPQLVYSRLKQICKHLIFGRQEDAHEFLRYLVEAMEKSYLQRYKNYKELDQYSKETTPLNQILGGYLKTSVRCLSCGHVSTTFQHFQDLLLDIRKPNTIEEALDGYFAKERLEDMGYKCESCKKKVSAVKQFSLERSPISLCIQLKRFSMVGTKINKYIAIRPRLDLSKYATNKNGKEMFSYKLVAMVTHLGASQHCGHYTAIGLTEQGYYQFDDSCVRPISLPNVLNTNAYIIFYELDENHTSKHTRVNGGNNITKNIENIQNQQKDTGNASTSFNENLNMNSNGLFNSTATNEIDEKVLNNCFANKKSINPQLATDNLKKMENTKKNDEKTSTFVSTSLNCNNINLTNKSIENSSPSSKLSNNSNKLLTHFKDSTTKNDLSVSEQKPTEYRDHAENSAIMELGESCKFFNCNSKIVKDKSCNTIESKGNGNILVIDNLTKNEKPFDEFKNSSLPNMPKIDSIDSRCEISATSVDCGFQSKKSPVKQHISWIGPLSPNLLKQNSPNSIEIKTIAVHNGSKTSPIKSLVPYGYDADEDLSKDSSDYEILNEKTGLEVKNNSDKEFIKFNGDIEKEYFSTSNETSPEGSPETQRNKSNPPSPHVVKTKAGLWQVTPITPNGSPKAESVVKISNPGQSFSNPFVVSIPPSSFYFDKTNSNDNNIHIKRDEKCLTLKELTKFSHRGYGASVLSWNGTKSEMELVVNEEAREERKRQLEDDEENDIDRGRHKKTKNNGNQKQSDLIPGYNPFQEQQLQKNNEHNRPNWMTCNSNNRISNKINSTNRYNNYQNNFNSNYNDFDSNSISYINKTMNGKNNNIINKKNCNKFNIINNNSLNTSKNNYNHKSINNSKNIKNNGQINNNCFYRTEVSNNFNDNIFSNNNDNGNKNGYSQYNPFLNRTGNSNFFRRHNSKKFNSNRIHQKNGDWR